MVDNINNNAPIVSGSNKQGEFYDLPRVIAEIDSAARTISALSENSVAFAERASTQGGLASLSNVRSAPGVKQVKQYDMYLNTALATLVHMADKLQRDFQTPEKNSESSTPSVGAHRP
jgi:ABC-type phosphate/phosphonate transport system substrate-binding protein